MTNNNDNYGSDSKSFDYDILVEESLKKEEVIEVAKNSGKIKKSIVDKKIIKEIYVPGKIINIVTQWKIFL